jgi:hypothetical protein
MGRPKPCAEMEKKNPRLYNRFSIAYGFLMEITKIWEKSRGYLGYLFTDFFHEIFIINRLDFPTDSWVVLNLLHQCFVKSFY